MVSAKKVGVCILCLLFFCLGILHVFQLQNNPHGDNHCHPLGYHVDIRPSSIENNLQ